MTLAEKLECLSVKWHNSPGFNPKNEARLNLLDVVHNVEQVKKKCYIPRKKFDQQSPITLVIFRRQRVSDNEII